MFHSPRWYPWGTNMFSRYILSGERKKKLVQWWCCEITSTEFFFFFFHNFSPELITKINEMSEWMIQCRWYWRLTISESLVCSFILVLIAQLIRKKWNSFFIINCVSIQLHKLVLLLAHNEITICCWSTNLSSHLSAIVNYNYNYGQANVRLRAHMSSILSVLTV